MAWGDGSGQYLGPEYGGWYNPADEQSVPLFGSQDQQTGQGGMLLPGASVGYTNAMDSMGLVPNYMDSGATAASYQNGGINALGELGSGLSAASGGMSTAGSVAGGIGAVAGAYSNASTDTGSSVLSGAASGAMAGAAFGPWGMVIGGVIGGIAGLFGSKSKKNQEKKAFQQQEQLAVLPYQQQQANWLQQQGLEQKAISNYASGYTPGGFQYKNAFMGNKPGTPGFATPAPAGANLPNFNVLPPNVAPTTKDNSLGITGQRAPNSGVQVPQVGGMGAPTSSFAAPPPAQMPAAPSFSSNNATNSANISAYQKQYIDYINAQRQAAAEASMSQYSQFAG